jgi:hypothetical protein
MLQRNASMSCGRIRDEVYAERDTYERKRKLRIELTVRKPELANVATISLKKKGVKMFSVMAQTVYKGEGCETLYIYCFFWHACLSKFTKGAAEQLRRGKLGQNIKLSLSLITGDAMQMRSADTVYVYLCPRRHFLDAGWRNMYVPTKVVSVWNLRLLLIAVVVGNTSAVYASLVTLSTARSREFFRAESSWTCCFQILRNRYGFCKFPLMLTGYRKHKISGNRTSSSSVYTYDQDARSDPQKVCSQVVINCELLSLRQ